MAAPVHWQMPVILITLNKLCINRCPIFTLSIVLIRPLCEMITQKLCFWTKKRTFPKQCKWLKINTRGCSNEADINRLTQLLCNLVMVWWYPTRHFSGECLYYGMISPVTGCQMMAFFVWCFCLCASCWEGSKCDPLVAFGCRLHMPMVFFPLHLCPCQFCTLFCLAHTILLPCQHLKYVQCGQNCPHPKAGWHQSPVNS